jgi:glycosyltransferase involved in cell wall biosynthesis
MSPLKLFEYMASGKPILASDLPVLREILTDGVNCKLASPDDPSEWVKALELLVQDRAYAMKLGDVAKKELIEKYTWKCRAQKVLQGLKID